MILSTVSKNSTNTQQTSSLKFKLLHLFFKCLQQDEKSLGSEENNHFPNFNLFVTRFFSSYCHRRLANNIIFLRCSNKKSMYIDVWPMNLHDPNPSDEFDTSALFQLQLACILHMVIQKWFRFSAGFVFLYSV